MKISFLQRHRNLVAIYGLLIGFIVLSSFLSPQFRTSYNIFNLFRQAVAYGLLSIGQTIAILSAGIDLSVGSLVSLTACLTSGIMIGNPQFVVPIVLFILALGVGVGTANGLLITQLRVPPFISTLAMSAFLQGSVLLYTKKPVGGVTRGFMFFANGQIGMVPFALIFWVLVIIAFLFLLQKTSLGLHIYAVGGNKEVARLSGVNLFKTIMMVYILSGGMAALTGLFLASRLGIGDPLIGQGMELESITAVLMGGTTFAGGKGGIIGTVAGVLIISLINNILNLMNVQGFWQWIIKGVIVIVVVAFYRERE